MNKPLKIFITYAHKDKAARDKLVTHLDVLMREGLIAIWNDNEITPGDTWRDVIFSNLAESDLLLHLVSASSLASEACNKELAIVLDAKTTVIPIILESCDWTRHPLSGYQALPDNGKPINEWFPESKGWQNVVAGIRKAFYKARSQAELGFQQGNVFMMIGQIDKAIDTYSHVLDLNASDADTYFNRGLAYHDKGDLDRAIGDYTKAVELRPDFAWAYTNRGLVYKSKGNFDLAIGDHNRAIELKPDHADAYFNRGNAYQDKGDFDRAIGDYTKAIELKPDFAGAYTNCGAIHLKKGELDQAIDDYNSAIQLRPQFAEAYHNRGEAYRKKGKVDRAIEDFNKAIGLNPNNAEAYNNRGAAYHKKGDVVYAIQDYSMAIGLNPEFADAYTHRGNVYLSKTDIHRAIEDYNAAIKLNPDAGFAYGNCGVAWLHLRHWGNAKVDLTVAGILSVNIIALFHDICKSVEDFEQKTGIQLPEDIAAMLTPQAASIELAKENRQALALKGYETGELSTGLAARLAGVPYSEFLLLMSQHGLSPFGETAEELASDFANAHKASCH